MIDLDNYLQKWKLLHTIAFTNKQFYVVKREHIQTHPVCVSLTFSDEI